MNPMEIENDMMDQDDNNESLPLILPRTSGEGLPYAPINWPQRGDNWTWKVGTRIAKKGHFIDRYLYPPKHLPSPGAKHPGFKSKRTLKHYLQQNFPNSDVASFFASFTWKIPAQLFNGSDSSEEDEDLDTDFEGIICKAGNNKCISLTEQDTASYAACDVCCVESRFCRACCCILCNKYVNFNHEGYSFIKCEGKLSEGLVCGHVAHINCAARCYLAGTVPGGIGLNVEYVCRLCDSKMDLIPRAVKILELAGSVSNEKTQKEILSLGYCILKGSEKNAARVLLSQIEQELKKLTPGNV